MREQVARDLACYEAAKRAKQPYSRTLPVEKRAIAQLCDDIEAQDCDPSRIDLTTLWYLKTVWQKGDKYNRHKMVQLYDSDDVKAGRFDT